MQDDWISQIGKHSFKKYSQSGEEGYIKFILDQIGWDDRFIVDIGAWDGIHLSNTKYFVDEHNCKALLIDGDNRGNENVQEEWVVKENVCTLLEKYSCPKEFTFLSYDTDGNDYWILDELLKKYSPALIVCEFNGTIQNGISKTIKYNAGHVWGNDDYYGFSFEAGKQLAQKHGYRVVFQNDSLNLYLVRRNRLIFPDQHIPITYTPMQYHAHNDKGLWELV